MKSAFLALALLALAAPAQAAGPEAFDIVCAATMTFQHIDREGKPQTGATSQATELEYSIDLASRRWCAKENCLAGQTRPIAEVSETTVLMDRQNDIPGAEGEWRFNRVDGTLNVLIKPVLGSEGLMISTTGPCRIEPFTAFPPKAG